MASPSHHHILLVTLASQGQINPSRHLARLLTSTSTSTTVHITIATPVSSHRLLFPSSTATIIDDTPNISYASYSDGYDAGFDPTSDDVSRFLTQLPVTGSRALTLLLESLSAAGRAATCVIYTFITDWAAEVASTLGIPSLLFWMQPATVLSVFYHYFNGYDTHISNNVNPSVSVKLPGVPLLRAKDLPYPITATPPDHLLNSAAGIISTLRRDTAKRPRAVIINTFSSLEPDALDSLREYCSMEVIPIGPLMSTSSHDDKDLFQRSDASEYMKWLDSKEARSVVYVSFGSLSRLSSREVEVLWRALRESGRPYLWVVRRDVAREGGELRMMISSRRSDDDGSLVIEWCEQGRVLMHGSVGCFVTHCGWNSVVESLVGGVPMVMMPQRMEQSTNAKMVEDVWGCGVRVEGVEDVGRGLEVVMGKGMRGEGVRSAAEVWRQRGREAAAEAEAGAMALMRVIMDEI